VKTVKIDALKCPSTCRGHRGRRGPGADGTYTYPCCGGSSLQINPVKEDSFVQAKTFDEAKKS
jgi:hypothetical protein